MTPIGTAFFPGVPFGWVFVLSLLGLLVLASYIDARRLTIPKRLTLTILPLGVVFNTIRGGWLGYRGVEVWQLGRHGAAAGAVDGLLFAMAGFAAGFALFFTMWLLKTCGGGDVKLFAALGAWVGARLAVSILAVTIAVVLLVVTAGLVCDLVRAVSGAGDGSTGGRGRRRIVVFSLPVTVATAAVLVWSFRHDLSTIPSARGASVAATAPAR